MSYFANVWGALWGKPYLKAGNLSIANEEPLTDADIESIDIEFARKAREAVRWLTANNPDLASIVSTKTAGVVGAKVTIQSRIDDANELNNGIEEYIKEWGEVENCEITGRWHLNGLFRAMAKFSEKDGGFIVRHHYNEAWKIPYRPELIEVGMIDVSQYDKKKNIINGLKKDKYGRVTDVYLYKNQDRTESSAVSMDELIYFMVPDISISQYTAITKLASILPSIEKLDKYTDEELKAAIGRAKDGAYWFTDLFAPISDMITDKKQSEAEIIAKVTPAQRTTAAIKKLKDQGIPAKGLTAVPAGQYDKIEKPSSESDSIYKDLAASTIGTASAATGQAAIITHQDPSQANYSAMKGVIELTKKTWDIDWDDLESLVVRPILHRVIRVGFMTGKLKAKDYFTNPRKYQKLEFIRKTIIDIEPVKTAKANQQNISNNLDTPRDVVARNGQDYIEMMKKKISDEIEVELLENEMRKAANLPEKQVDSDVTNN